MPSQSLTVPQTSFPGQAAAPEGPCDLPPMYLMHHAFRRDLRAFVDAAAHTPVDDRRTWRRLAERWDRFGRILHLHHAGEDDVLWPLLLSRVDAAGDAGARTVLDDMEAEHDEIDPLLEACATGLNQLATGADDDSRAALVVRLSAALERLGAHLGHEESDAMALVQEHISPAEWEALHEKFGADYTLADSLFALPWLMPGVPAKVRARVEGFLGRPASLAERVLLRPGFLRRDRLTFRYADHPPVASTGTGTALRRVLPASMATLLATDLAGGLLDIAAGRTTLATAWGPAATLCAPWPMIAFQVSAVAVVLRGGRRLRRIAGGLLALACAVSIASGFFDGQLAANGLTAPEVAFQTWLLLLTGVVGGSALAVFGQKE